MKDANEHNVNTQAASKKPFSHEEWWLNRYMEKARATWVPPGTSVTVHGRVIADGMVYVGGQLIGG